MKKTLLSFVGLILLLSSCNVEIKRNTAELWKAEVIETEKNFSEMAAQKGIAVAFLAFAAEDAVVMRNNKLVIGRDELSRYLEMQATGPEDELLSWKPDFVDVSASGDLAYTYGQFTYSYTDSTGTRVESEGVFHTVWKRQEDGSWRFVWD